VRGGDSARCAEQLTEPDALQISATRLLLGCLPPLYSQLFNWLMPGGESQPCMHVLRCWTCKASKAWHTCHQLAAWRCRGRRGSGFVSAVCCVGLWVQNDRWLTPTTGSQ